MWSNAENDFELWVIIELPQQPNIEKMVMLKKNISPK